MKCPAFKQMPQNFLNLTLYFTSLKPTNFVLTLLCYNVATARYQNNKIILVRVYMLRYSWFCDIVLMLALLTPKNITMYKSFICLITPIRSYLTLLRFKSVPKSLNTLFLNILFY